MTTPALVVCPTSLAPNWADEFARFAPDLSVVVMHGSDRHDHREEAELAASILEGGGAASLRFTPEDLADLLRPLG